MHKPVHIFRARWHSEGSLVMIEGILLSLVSFIISRTNKAVCEVYSFDLAFAFAVELFNEGVALLCNLEKYSDDSKVLLVRSSFLVV